MLEINCGTSEVCLYEVETYIHFLNFFNELPISHENFLKLSIINEEKIEEKLDDNIKLLNKENNSTLLKYF
jgi:hypothetical protein